MLGSLCQTQTHEEFLRYFLSRMLLAHDLPLDLGSMVSYSLDPVEVAMKVHGVACLLLRGAQWLQRHLSETVLPIQFLCILSKANWASLCARSSDSSCCPTDLCVCHFTSATLLHGYSFLIGLKVGYVSPSNSFFFKNYLGYSNSLHFHRSFRTRLSIATRNPWNFEVALSLQSIWR